MGSTTKPQFIRTPMRIIRVDAIRCVRVRTDSNRPTLYIACDDDDHEQHVGDGFPMQTVEGAKLALDAIDNAVRVSQINAIDLRDYGAYLPSETESCPSNQSSNAIAESSSVVNTAGTSKRTGASSVARPKATTTKPTASARSTSRSKR